MDSNAYKQVTRMNNRQLGFSLSELVITVAILGILTAVALPSYQNHVLSSRRSDGHMALLKASQDLERCKTRTFTYAGCNVVSTTPMSESGYYKLSIADVTATTFTLTATPQDPQTRDTDCGFLTLDQNGVRDSETSDSNCW